MSNAIEQFPLLGVMVNALLIFGIVIIIVSALYSIPFMNSVVNKKKALIEQEIAKKEVIASKLAKEENEAWRKLNKATEEHNKFRNDALEEKNRLTAELDQMKQQLESPDKKDDPKKPDVVTGKKKPDTTRTTTPKVKISKKAEKYLEIKPVSQEPTPEVKKE
jgi:hypothetical protein